MNIHDPPPPDPGPAGEPVAYETPDLERPSSASPSEAQLEQETLGGRDAAGHDAYAAWRYPAFRLFIVGWLCTLLGGQMQSAAVAYEIYRHTGRALDLGILGLIGALPVILLALPAGHIADRFDRVRVTLLGQSVAILCSAALALVSHRVARHGAPVWLLYVPLFVNGIGLTFARAARSALLPALVPGHVFNNAVTWNSSVFETSSMAGPALGGVLIGVSLAAVGSLALPYALAAVLGVVYVVLLAVLARKHPPRPVERKATERGLLDGIRFVWRTKVVLGAITLDLFAVLLGGATFLLPVFAQRLGAGAFGYGLLRAAPAVGAFSTALLQAHLPPMKRAGRSMLLAVAGFGAATVVFGLSNSFGVSLVMLALTGAFDNVSVVVRHTLVQLMTPDSMRGRVSAVNNVFIGASNELGGLESGLTAAAFGPVASVVGGGVGTILVVALVTFAWPAVRTFGSLRHAKPEEEPDGRGFEVLPAKGK